MKKSIILSLSIALALMTTSCGGEEKDNDPFHRMRWLEHADPIDDAKSALTQGNYELRAVNGFTVSVPGVKAENYRAVRKKYKYNLIEGTSDFLAAGDHAKLNRQAINYAKRYNQYILENDKRM